MKVEPPNGDGLRPWPPLTGGFSENFASLNRNKESVVLDLKAPADRDLARRLVLAADADERFALATDRVRHQNALKTTLEDVFTRQPADHWIAAVLAVGVPHARINDYAAALADPQTQHLQWVQALDLPNGTQTFVSPIRINGQGLRCAPARRRWGNTPKQSASATRPPMFWNEATQRRHQPAPEGIDYEASPGNHTFVGYRMHRPVDKLDWPGPRQRPMQPLTKTDRSPQDFAQAAPPIFRNP